MDRVLFVPWSRNEEPGFIGQQSGQEYISTNQNWIDHARKNNKEFVEIWYTGTKHLLMAAMLDGQIYIRGHSEESLGEVFSGSYKKKDWYGMGTGPAMKGNLDAHAVGLRLIETGLRQEFAGKLKCYNCWGALGGKYGFAQKFADYMWEKGYKNCTFYGYRGAVDSFPDANLHHIKDPSVAEKLKGHKTVEFENKTLARAKDGRDKIVPSQLK